MKGLKILIVAFVCLLAQSCTCNDGDIGPLWGTWRVTELEINNEKVEDYSGTLYFCFQASVYVQRYVYEEIHGKDEVTAAWDYEGDDLLIYFSGVNGSHKPLAITGMQIGENLVEVVKSSGDNMTLSYENPDGVVYTYYLKKW